MCDVLKHFTAKYLNEKVYTFSLELPSINAGSKQLQQITAIKNIKELDDRVNEFVAFIWKEAVGHLREIFEDTFQNITDEQACY
jgi:transcriptional regulator with AAA-type ATPase domain